MKVNAIKTGSVYTDGMGRYRLAKDYLNEDRDNWVVFYDKIIYISQSKPIHKIGNGQCSLETFASWSKYAYANEDEFASAQWIMVLANNFGDYREDLVNLSADIQRREKGIILEEARP